MIATVQGNWPRPRQGAETRINSLQVSSKNRIQLPQHLRNNDDGDNHDNNNNNSRNRKIGHVLCGPPQGKA